MPYILNNEAKNELANKPGVLECWSDKHRLNEMAVNVKGHQMGNTYRFRYMVAPKDLIKNHIPWGALKGKKKVKIHKSELWPSPHWLAANFLNFTQAVYSTDRMVIAKLLNDHKLQPWGKYSWKLTSHLILTTFPANALCTRKSSNWLQNFSIPDKCTGPSPRSWAAICALCWCVVAAVSLVGQPGGGGVLLKEEQSEDQWVVSGTRRSTKTLTLSLTGSKGLTASFFFFFQNEWHIIKAGTLK